MIRPEIRLRPAGDLDIPELFSRLRDIAYNLWWTWSPDAHRLFDRLSPSTWRQYRNPIDVLIDVGAQRWRGLADDDDFARLYHTVVEQFDAYLSPAQPPWFERNHGDYEGGPFAYFCAEFGWHECLQTYSGGLGVLAGDHCKSASDLGLPFVGIGLMYRHGYFRQSIDAEGYQQHFYPDYDLQRLPLLPVLDPQGKELQVSVDFPDRDVQLRVWCATVGRVPVLLLDSDLPINHPADRAITSALYVRGREMRLCQEILLGFGGALALRALGVEPGTWHINEGHSALLLLQRMRWELERDGALPDPITGRVALDTLFTTHTPVPAGNESFDLGLVRSYLAPWSEQAGLDLEQLLPLGRTVEGGETFNLTALALRGSSRANGVSELHGKMANGMWKPLLDGSGLAPIEHVTNGIHVASWVGPEIRHVLHKHVDPELDDEQSLAEEVAGIPDHELWTAHLTQKQRMIRRLRGITLEQFARHGRSPAELREVDSLLDADALTIGFARRFATYKRADLILRDIEKLHALVGDPERPVQIVFAGKAHPADRPGQDLIRRIHQASLTDELRGKLLFVESYDMRVARHLVQGVDLWLNTPRRPHEASGTSGMKAAANGVLNCSILDGWWCEGFDAGHGWVIGTDEESEDDEAADAADSDSLHRVLAEEIVPAFYERSDGGLPVEWIRRMKRSIGLLTPRFSSARMVREYVEKYYLTVGSPREGGVTSTG